MAIFQNQVSAGDGAQFHPALVCLRLVSLRLACGKFIMPLGLACGKFLLLFACGKFHSGLLAVSSTPVCLRLVPLRFASGGYFHYGFLAVSFN